MACRKKETNSKQPKTRMKTCTRRDCKGQSVGGKMKVKEKRPPAVRTGQRNFLNKSHKKSCFFVQYTAVQEVSIRELV